MHSENIAAYVGLDVHKETLAVAIAAPMSSNDYASLFNICQA